jgi:hypothetical protein
MQFREARVETLQSDSYTRSSSGLVSRVRVTGPEHYMLPHIDRHLHLRMGELIPRG